MKNKLIAFLVILLFPIMVWAGQDFGTVFDAAVYRSPNADSELITTVEVGSKLHITAFDHDNYWARIVLPDGQTGYVDTGCLDYPGGQTVTVTETFDANNVASKQAAQTDMVKLITSIVFFLLLVAALGHMFYIRANEDNEPRIFIGSGIRLALFALLMSCGVFMADGFWGVMVSVFGGALLVVFSYYACLRPRSKLLVEGAPGKNVLQFLSGMWGNLETEKADKVKIGLLEEKIKELKFRKSGCSSQGERSQFEYEIAALESETRAEENRVLDQAVVLTFVSIAMGLVFIWLTPFAAILQYVRNYPLYLRKREVYRQKAAKIGYID